MGSTDRHLAHANRIVEILKTITWPDGIKADEVRRSEDVFSASSPGRGIHVIVNEEDFGIGVSNKTDVRYKCTVVRVIPVSTHQRDSLNYRSQFRILVRQYLNDLRIMTDGSCEIITKVKPSQMRFPREWRKSLDVSAMEVTTLIREVL
jgi:hypothetical protein